MLPRSSIVAALVAIVIAAAQAARGAEEPRWIVFSGSAGVLPAQLYRIQTTGAGLQHITTGAKAASDPSFSPDGKRIAFARLGGGIFVVNLDGSGLRRLTAAGHDNFPVWSPNGKQIAFRRLGKKAWRLYVMTANGTRQVRLPLAPPASRPSWSPAGKWIFFAGPGEVDQVDARTGRVRKRSYVNRISPATSQAATMSPNSRSVAFVADRPPAGCEQETCIGFGLYLGQIPGGQLRLVAVGAGPAGWSPDGKRLVFAYRGSLSLWPVAGGQATTVSTGEIVVAADSPPAWQPR